ncbi:MAG: hypothetical protein ACTSQG_01790 [Promethearchaeota archaeon]
MEIVDPQIGYLIIFVLPVIGYYFLKVPRKLFFLFLLFTIPFLAGSLELLGFLSVNYYNYIIEFFILGLFINQYIKKKGNIRLDGLVYILIFIGICIFSKLINNTSFLQLFLYLKRILIPIIFFWYLRNLRLKENEYKLFNRIIITLFLSQIPVAIGKYFIVGQTERYMGTMTIFGGSLTTAFALFGIVIFLTFFIYYKKKLYLIPIGGFFLFALIGAKKVMFLIAPLMILLMYFFSIRRINPILILKRSITAFLLAIPIFYFSIVLHPALNPENKIGGSFNVEYLTKFFQDYLFPDREIQGVRYYGRGEAFIGVWNLFKQKENTSHLFLGFGPGDLIMSQFIDLPSFSIRRIEDLIAYKYNIGYGGRSGLLWNILQVGLLGVIVFLSYYFSLFKKVFTMRKKYKKVNILIVLMLGLIAIWIFDFFTYSRIMLESYPVVLPFFWFLNQTLKINKNGPYHDSFR